MGPIAALPLWLYACSGCSGCIPGPGNQARDTTHRTDTGPRDSTTDSAPDTAPVPPCDQPEVEPDDFRDEANPIELERWACGTFEDGIDPDYFIFQVPETARWIRVDVDAQSRGTAADPQMLMESDRGETAFSDRDPWTNDPLVVFPVDTAQSWRVLLNEQQGGDGPEYAYFLMVSVAKAPVGWTAEDPEEQEGGDTGSAGWLDDMSQAMPVEPGDVVFGRIGHPDDLDWYALELPQGKGEYTFRVVAFDAGSPLDPRLVLRDPSGDKLDAASVGANAYDRDPVLVRSSDGGETWYIEVKAESTNVGAGSAYWYVLEVEAD